jgi:hypothetical protein
MKLRTFALAAAVVAAFSPTICNASPERAAVNACARAFAARIANEPAAAPRYKLDYRDSWSTGSIADYFPINSDFDLEAHDPKTGAVLARARCSTDTRGAVVAFSLLPLR